MVQSWQTIRVFISSTFRDMHAERDYLVKRVFPTLCRRLEKYRIYLRKSSLMRPLNSGTPGVDEIISHNTRHRSTMTRYVKVMLLMLGFLYTFSTDSGPPDDVAPWPTTLDAAVGDILTRMSEEDKILIRNLEKEKLIRYHHGWGTGIRNEFGLWRGNEALRVSACGKRCLPDTASMLIIEAVWEVLQESHLLQYQPKASMANETGKHQ